MLCTSHFAELLVKSNRSLSAAHNPIQARQTPATAELTCAARWRCRHPPQSGARAWPAAPRRRRPTRRRPPPRPTGGSAPFAWWPPAPRSVAGRRGSPPPAPPPGLRPRVRAKVKRKTSHRSKGRLGKGQKEDFERRKGVQPPTDGGGAQCGFVHTLRRTFVRRQKTQGLLLGRCSSSKRVPKPYLLLS